MPQKLTAVPPAYRPREGERLPSSKESIYRPQSQPETETVKKWHEKKLQRNYLKPFLLPLILAIPTIGVIVYAKRYLPTALFQFEERMVERAVTTTLEQPGTNTYRNTTFGFSFDYPDTMFLAVTPLTDPQRTEVSLNAGGISAMKFKAQPVGNLTATTYGEIEASGQRILAGRSWHVFALPEGYSVSTEAVGPSYVLQTSYNGFLYRIILPGQVQPNQEQETVLASLEFLAAPITDWGNCWKATNSIHLESGECITQEGRQFQKP